MGGLGRNITSFSSGKGRLGAVTAALLLGTLLLTGILLHRDYGVSWDETDGRRFGRVAWDYVFHKDRGLLAEDARYHGTLFYLLLEGVERVSGASDTREIFLLRHLVTFLAFVIGVFCFHRLCRRLFPGRGAALLGCAMLVLAPRIFSDSFYNAVDIPFLAAFVAAALALVTYLADPRPASLGALCLASAVLVDIRVIGVILPLLAVAMILWRMLGQDRGKGRSAEPVRDAVIYLGATAALVVAFWPLLWDAPLGHFAAAIRESLNYPAPMDVLYRGKVISDLNVPWHYTITWIGITTPVLYLLLAVVGTAGTILSLLRGGVVFTPERAGALLPVAWLFGPLAYLALASPVQFDGWRHSFFLYPALVLLALRGVLLAGGAARRAGGAAARLGLAALLAGYLASVAFAMIREHPYQNVYFNCLVGGLRGARFRFEMDYWGLAHRRGLEEILERDPAERITVCSASMATGYNMGILTRPQRDRLVFTHDCADADYLLLGYRATPREYVERPRWGSVEVEGVPILSIFRMR